MALLIYSRVMQRYDIDIFDLDGISSVRFELLDQFDKHIRDLPYTAEKLTYSITIDTAEFESGKYYIVATASGALGGSTTGLSNVMSSKLSLNVFKKGANVRTFRTQSLIYWLDQELN